MKVLMPNQERQINTLRLIADVKSAQAQPVFAVLFRNEAYVMEHGYARVWEIESLLEGL